MKIFLILTLIAFVLSSPASAQDQNAHSMNEESGFNIVLGFLYEFFLPPVVSDVYKLRAYIADLPVQEGSSRGDRLARLDSIYNRAVALTGGRIGETLFICSFATLPYHTFDAVVPLFGWVITVPVSSESHEAFARRLANLPGGLFTNKESTLDKDKLPHFFGSAYLEYIVQTPIAVMGIGEAVEIGETIFKLEGAYDAADIDANSRGVEFGKALLAGKNVMPSDFLERNGY
ncbi:MAG: hypothetical protein CL946_07100 [Ectothiorhodospiraceae bacterium]|nr:hypothetical protein [Ectothiorhodospiraceae bacterium]